MGVDLIETVRGMGYRIRSEGEVEGETKGNDN